MRGKIVLYKGFSSNLDCNKVSVESGVRRSGEHDNEDCNLRDLETLAIRNALQKHNCNVSEGNTFPTFHKVDIGHQFFDPSPTNSDEDRASQGFVFKSPVSKVSMESSGCESQQVGYEDCSIRDLEARAIRNALQKHNCNVSEASRRLGISRSSIYRKMRGSGIVKMSLVN